jgi:hypothetical protein
VLALKAIPDQIRVWQASDTPKDVGRRVTATIAGKLKAESAALAVFEDGTYRSVAAQGVEAADVDSWLATLGDEAIEPIVFDDPLFAYRFPLADAAEPVGLLLVARREGGVGFARRRNRGNEEPRHPARRRTSFGAPSRTARPPPYRDDDGNRPANVYAGTSAVSLNEICE